MTFKVTNPGYITWNLGVPFRRHIWRYSKLRLIALRLIEPPRDRSFLARISGLSYYPADLFSKKSKYPSKSGSNKWWDLLTEVSRQVFEGFSPLVSFFTLPHWTKVKVFNLFFWPFGNENTCFCKFVQHHHLQGDAKNNFLVIFYWWDSHTL